MLVWDYFVAFAAEEEDGDRAGDFGHLRKQTRDIKISVKIRVGYLVRCPSVPVYRKIIDGP